MAMVCSGSPFGFGLATGLKLVEIVAKIPLPPSCTVEEPDDEVEEDKRTMTPEDSTSSVGSSTEVLADGRDRQLSEKSDDSMMALEEVPNAGIGAKLDLAEIAGECEPERPQRAGKDEESLPQGISPSLKGPRTTLMIRNVPIAYTPQMLASEWPNNGTYDFLYLPYNCALKRNLSYTFVNFTKEEHALAFKDFWHKQRLAHFTSRKPLNISFAVIQGLKANLIQVKRKKVARVQAYQSQPLVFGSADGADPCSERADSKQPSDLLWL